MSVAAGQASPGVAPTGTPNAPRLPGHLAAHPRLSQWIALGADGTATVTPGKVEIGQGIVTALASVVAGELALPPARVRMVPASTATSPNEAVTSGSLSMQESGAALRHVAAQLRTRLVEAAAARWGVAPEGLRVDDGRVLDGAGRALGYGELAAALDPGDLADPAFTALAAPGALVPDAPRRDLPDKVFGRARFIHDLALPGLLHGRVVRPPSPAATLRALDEMRVRACPGLLALVRDGRFLGVVCAREHEAQAAARVLAQAASWDEPATLPDANALPAWLKAQRSEPRVVDDTGHADAEHAPDAVDTRSGTRGGARAADGAPSGSRVSAQEAPSATRRFTARYSKPFIAHASIGPSCAIARRDGDALHVWSHAQGPFNLRADLAIAFGLRADAVVVEHVEGAGCYGHNPADDVAYDAARLAAEVPGRPVRVLWSRADELAWCAFGSAMTVELDAMVDAHGRLAQWRHESWSAGHGLRPGRAGTPTLLGSWHLAEPFPVLPAFDASPASGGGSDRNAAPAYRALLRLSPLLSVWVAFLVLIVFMPNTVVRKRPAAISALVAAILWILWQKIYISLQVGVARYNAIYGTFASVPIFLLWLYVGCMIILLGAELAFALQNHHTYALERAAGHASVRSRTLLALLALSEAARGFATGGRLDAHALAERQGVPIRLVLDVLRVLARAGYLTEIAEPADCYVLARPPDCIPAAEVARLLAAEGAPPAQLGLAALETRYARVLDVPGATIANLIETA